MLRPFDRRALVAAFVLALVLVPTASARHESDVVPSAEFVAPLPEPELVEEPFSLTMPAFGQLTSKYGLRWGRMHRGVDIGVLTKLGVVAAAAGTVTHVGYLPHFAGYGQVIRIDHGNGYETLYAHLSRMRVAPGDEVESGAWIGNAGCTGSCTGTHLHFELRDRGVPIDPLPFFVAGL
jgi:murein DD-endopeptidase MepM/ murein hydrolase activator NlpD